MSLKISLHSTNKKSYQFTLCYLCNNLTISYLEEGKMFIKFIIIKGHLFSTQSLIFNTHFLIFALLDN